MKTNIDLEVSGYIKSIGTADVSKFESSEQAFPTSRLLDGSRDHGFAEEWAEPGTYDGKPARRIYLFNESDITYNGDPIEADTYPWDNEHTARIVLDEMPED